MTEQEKLHAMHIAAILRRGNESFLGRIFQVISTYWLVSAILSVLGFVVGLFFLWTVLSFLAPERAPHFLPSISGIVGFFFGLLKLGAIIVAVIFLIKKVTKNV